MNKHCKSPRRAYFKLLDFIFWWVEKDKFSLFRSKEETFAKSYRPMLRFWARSICKSILNSELSILDTS
jgi:hypothetical protein